MGIDSVLGWSTYEEDVPLLKELKLRHQYGGEPWDKCFLGAVDVDGAVVKVTVCGAPAQFFEFEIAWGQVRRAVVKTGSGKLKDFWPSIVLIAQDMISVREA